MTEEKPVQPMPPSTREALLGAIAKWEAIAAGHGEDRGSDNCPLCQLFLEEKNCRGCPVFEKTRKTLCRETPFEDFDDLKFSIIVETENWTLRSPDSFPLDRRPAAIAAAQAEVDFLRSLLPPEPSDAE